jgi:hypothetical protein
MLPSLHNLWTDGKRKRELLPCHDELRYEDGELVNRNRDRRVQGRSASFSLDARDLPFGTSLTTIEQILALSRRTQTSWENVLQELYSDRTAPPTTPSKEQREDEAFVRRYDNLAKPQYYLLTVQRETTLYHIKPDGDFWDLGMSVALPVPAVGDVCYTNGFVWTNPEKHWAWKSGNGEINMRVRIEIPVGTQVVIDRAPVYGGSDCQFDEKRSSLFPDVLLGPAEFRVMEVKRYRSTQDDYEDSEEPSDRFLYVEPLERGLPESDREYAQRRVFDNHEFADVRVAMVRQVKVPTVGSVQFP